MKISAKTNYACKALLELSIHWPSSEPLPIQGIANNQKIPIKFLTHILIQLKQFGYVESSRGQKGGYILAKSPREIRLSDVINDFNEIQIRPTSRSKDISKDVFDQIWNESDEVLTDHFKKITFEHIKNRLQNIVSEPLYMI